MPTENISVDFVPLDLAGASNGGERQRRPPRVSNVPQEDVSVDGGGGEVIGVCVRPIQIRYHPSVRLELRVLL